MKKLVTEELLKKVDNRFLLSIAASKRARQLKDGAVPLVEGAEGQPELLIALDEIMEDKIKIEIEKKEAIVEAKVEKKKTEKKSEPKLSLKKAEPKKTKSKAKAKAKK